MSNETIGRLAAEKCREEWGLGVAPIGNLPRLIEERAGVGVALIRTPAPGHGMTMRLGDITLIAAGCTPHPMRLRSTLAHELGHLRIASVNRRLSESTWSERREEEIQADAFARHFLLPIEAVRAASGNNADIVLSNAVQDYGVSPSIAAIQMRDANLITVQQYSAMSGLTTKNIAVKHGWLPEYEARARESMQTRAPQSLMARAIEAYRWNQVSASTLARLQGEKDARRYAELLEREGIVPKMSDTEPERPTIVADGLTPAELDFLLNG